MINTSFLVRSSDHLDGLMAIAMNLLYPTVVKSYSMASPPNDATTWILARRFAFL